MYKGRSPPRFREQSEPVHLKSAGVPRREENRAMKQFYVNFRVDGVLGSAYVAAPTYEEAFSEAERCARAQYPGLDVEVLAVQLLGAPVAA